MASVAANDFDAVGADAQEALDRLATLREGSLFRAEVARRLDSMRSKLRGSRVLVVGGAGSIGSATVGLLSTLGPAALHVVDQGENYLAELVRELRGRKAGLPVADFRALPLDYGSPIMRAFLREAAPYDWVLNFAALKHVRSEKDAFSLLQMLDTNVVAHARFKRWLADGGHARNYFAVSTDKAANPTSLMGASKRMMEDVAFDAAHRPGQRTTSARFANVAFSNGSLLQGAVERIQKGQPVPVPRETRRYFVSRREAGEICLLACMEAQDGHIVFPRMEPREELKLLDEVMARIVAHLGYRPAWFEDEEAARGAVEECRARGEWPVLLTPLDTSGEKPYEEFVGAGEAEVASGFESLGALRHVRGQARIEAAIARLERLASGDGPVSKAEVAAVIAAAVPGMRHRETGKTLDDRL